MPNAADEPDAAKLESRGPEVGGCEAAANGDEATAAGHRACKKSPSCVLKRDDLTRQGEQKSKRTSRCIFATF